MPSSTDFRISWADQKFVAYNESLDPSSYIMHLAIWGASVNIMTKMVYDCLDEDLLVPVSWCL
jgi:hypothetical protein